MKKKNFIKRISIGEKEEEAAFADQRESEEDFSPQKDEPVFFSFLDHLPPPTSHLANRSIKKCEERPSLNILNYEKTESSDSLNEVSNRNLRMKFSKQGKVIRIGSAVFKSNFESGNLSEVAPVRANTFRICMEKEVNSNRTSAWFYFRCEGLKGEVNFIITGFTKARSLFNQGMKVCYRQVGQSKLDSLSQQKNESVRSVWKRGCSKISYQDIEDEHGEHLTYELRFTHYFKNSESGPIEFAYCFPYEYSRAYSLSKELSKKEGVEMEVLGTTYQNRQIPMLSIGNPKATKSIVVSARVHPGESVSSFIMEGFLKELTSNSMFARKLRAQYFFRVVPMINPDGVVRGNYRFSAAGYDLNRRWKNCTETSHPEIYYLKNMIKKLNKEKKVVMYIDIHGHSRKKNAFFYGCGSASTEEEVLSKPKEFPFLMENINSNYKYEFCTFSVSKDKEGTARISMWKELKIDHVYTLESTFCGSTTGANYLQEDYLKLGKSLMEGISIYFYDQKASEVVARDALTVESTTIDMENSGNSDNQSEETFEQEILKFRETVKKQLMGNSKLLKVGDVQDCGSDSEPEAGFIPEVQRVPESQRVQRGQPSSKNKEKVQGKEKNFRSSLMGANSEKRQIKGSYLKTSQTKKRNRLTSEELKKLVDEKMKHLGSSPPEPPQQKVPAQIELNFFSCNSQQLSSLTSDSLIQRNDRVHSKHAARQGFERIRSNRVNSENDPLLSHTQANEEDVKLKSEIANRFLLKTREGAQYRRVKKIAEQMKRKTNTTFSEMPPTPVVRGITTVQNQLTISNKSKIVTPSFYPRSDQKSRKFSAELAFKYKHGKGNYVNNSFTNGTSGLGSSKRKFMINGDDLNVHCKGNRISF